MSISNEKAIEMYKELLAVRMAEEKLVEMILRSKNLRWKTHFGPKVIENPLYGKSKDEAEVLLDLLEDCEDDIEKEE